MSEKWKWPKKWGKPNGFADLGLRHYQSVTKRLTDEERLAFATLRAKERQSMPPLSEREITDAMDVFYNSMHLHLDLREVVNNSSMDTEEVADLYDDLDYYIKNLGDMEAGYLFESYDYFKKRYNALVKDDAEKKHKDSPPKLLPDLTQQTSAKVDFTIEAGSIKEYYAELARYFGQDGFGHRFDVAVNKINYTININELSNSMKFGVESTTINFVRKSFNLLKNIKQELERGEGVRRNEADTIGIVMDSIGKSDLPLEEYYEKALDYLQVKLNDLKKG